jgi:hypothetical protein
VHFTTLLGRVDSVHRVDVDCACQRHLGVDRIVEIRQGGTSLESLQHSSGSYEEPTTHLPILREGDVHRRVHLLISNL